MVSAVRRGGANVSVSVRMENVKSLVSDINKTTNNYKYLFTSWVWQEKV